MELLKRKNVLVIYSVTAVLMLVGTFADLQISNAVFDSGSVFATFFAGIGELPAMLCPWIGVALLVASMGEVKGSASVTRWALATVILVVSSFFLIEPYRHLPSGLNYVGVALELAVCAAAFAWVLRAVDRTDATRLTRVATVLIALVVLSFIIITVVKIPWGRPRYRSIIVTEGLEYQPWYVIGSAARDALEGILGRDEFKSFPSGHVANAACSLALPLLTFVVPSLRGKERVLTVGALVWTVLLMFARIVKGAHFLTDVTVGFLVTFTLLVVLYATLARDMPEA